MIVVTARLEIATDDGASLSDVTGEVNAYLRATGISSGLCVLSAPSEGSCLTLSAALDEDVDDLLRLARSFLVEATRDDDDPLVLERRDRMEADAAGYTPAGVLADCLSLPVRDGVVGLGTWEAIVLLDARGPAQRAIDVTVMGS